MSGTDEKRMVEQLMLEWDARRVTEAYRRTRFRAQRNDALERWTAHGPHAEVEERYVAFRVSHTDMVLAEIMELEVRADAAYDQCRTDLDAFDARTAKEQRRSLAKVRQTCEDALSVAMRYRHSLNTTLQHEVAELVTYIEDRIEAAG